MTPRNSATRAIPQRVRSESGSVLVAVLLFTVVVTIMITALVAFASTNQKSVNAYRSLRADRYAGDEAIKSAVNWAKDKHDVARDPTMFADAPCVYKIPSTNTIVSCAATAGERSGTPDTASPDGFDHAKVPEQALLLLGQRYGDPGPNSPCDYGDSTAAGNPGNFDPRGNEVGLRLDGTRPTGILAYSGGNGWKFGWKAQCQAVGDAAFNANLPVTINGPVISNAPVVVNDGWLSVLAPYKMSAGTSPRYENKGCSTTRSNVDNKRIQGTCEELPLDGSHGTRADPTGKGAADPFNPGEKLATDPALGPNKAQWRQGIINWRAPSVSINGAAPVALNGIADGTLNAACNGTASNVIRFYPGWYSSVKSLNTVFANAKCKKGVYWFGPAADAADSLATTALDETTASQGVYLFDFRDAASNAGDWDWWKPREYQGTACGELNNDNYKHRWCLNPSTTDPGARLLGGWPTPTAMNGADWFPAPTPENPVDEAVYCDENKPGVQFIFGGDSTVRASDAVMQLCAGEAPGANGDDYQKIAVWGQPQNFLTKAGGPTGQTTERESSARAVSLLPKSFAISKDECSTGCGADSVERSMNGNSPYSKPGQVKTPAAHITTAETSGKYHGVRLEYEFGQVKPYGECAPAKDVCFDDATQKVGRVDLKLSYDAKCDWTTAETDCDRGDYNWSAHIDLWSPKFLGGVQPLCDRPEAFPGTKSQKTYTYVVTDCFMSTGGVDKVILERLNSAKLRVKHRWPGAGKRYYLGDDQRIKEQAAVELIVTLVPKDPTTQVVMPAGGCRVSPYGYSSGLGDGHSHIDPAKEAHKNFDSNLAGRDCALISGGHVSIQGTVYAPSDAIELDNDDVRYAFVSRGLVARHLRVRRYLSPLSPPPPAISNYVDRSPKFREATFTACERDDMSDESACGKTGDKILASARVRFDKDVTPAIADKDRARIPSFIWWSTER